MNFASLLITPASLGRPLREARQISQWLYATGDLHQISSKRVGSYVIKLYHPYSSPKEFQNKFIDRVLHRKLHRKPKPTPTPTPEPPAPLQEPELILPIAFDPVMITEPPVRIRKKKRRAKTPRFK